MTHHRWVSWNAAVAGAWAVAAGTVADWPLRRPIAAAVTAPSSERPADNASAGRYPDATLAGLPRCPWAVNTAVAAATPKAPPNRWRVLFTPEARPMSAGGTAPSAAVAVAGSAIEMPTPATISGATNWP